MGERNMEPSSNNRSKTYIIVGDPIPLARCRFSRTHKAYDSQKEKKLVYGINLKGQHGEEPLFSGPLHIEIYFYFTPAVKAAKNITNTFHYIKPDIDNCAKWVLDVANELLFKDDCQVASLILTKRWSRPEPHTEIFIQEIGNSREIPVRHG